MQSAAIACETPAVRDADRLAELFDRHGPLVYRRALQILGSPQDAADATQEVFIRAGRSLHRFDGRARASTWLYRITTNYCLNSLRDARRRRDLTVERPDAFTPAPSLLAADDLAMLRALLADADPQQAEAALAVFVDGMSHAEAATVLGVSRRTVGNLCARFVEWARARIDGSGV